MFLLPFFEVPTFSADGLGMDFLFLGALLDGFLGTDFLFVRALDVTVFSGGAYSGMSSSSSSLRFVPATSSDSSELEEEEGDEEEDSTSCSWTLSCGSW